MRPFDVFRPSTLAALMLAASGCATVPMAPQEHDLAAKSFSTQSDLANLYVYRASSFGTAVKYPVTVDGKMLGELPGATYIFVRVPPGPHTVGVVAQTNKTQPFTAEAGRNHYVKVTPAMGFLQAAANLTLMTDEKEAQDDVKTCALIQVMQ